MHWLGWQAPLYLRSKKCLTHLKLSYPSTFNKHNYEHHLLLNKYMLNILLRFPLSLTVLVSVCLTGTKWKTYFEMTKMTLKVYMHIIITP